MLQVFRRSVILALLISALLFVPPLPVIAQDTRPETSQHLGDMGAVRPMARYPACTSEQKPCLSTGEIKDLQASLNKMGFEAGPPDGVFGPRTVRAIEQFRQYTGYAGEDPPKRSELLSITRYGERIKKTAPRPVGGLEGAIAGVVAGMVTGTLGGNPGNLRKKSGNLGAHQPKPTGTQAPGSQPAVTPMTKSAVPPMPTRLFSGPNQFEPRDFRGYGFLAFPAIAGEFDFERHMIFCQAFMNSLPSSSAVSAPTIDQFVTVWPIDKRQPAELLNNHRHRSETPAACKVAIDNYDGLRAHAVLRKIRANEGFALDGLGPYLFGWIPAEYFGEDGKLILMLDLSRVSTYEQALIQLQSWQQKIETNPELLNDGFSIENLRRLVRDWSDQHGQAFLVLIGAA